MIGPTVIKQLLRDRHSLADYYDGQMPSYDDVKRRLFLLEREENRLLPDQYYKVSEERCFGKLNSMSELLSTGLSSLTEEFLEWRNEKVFVKQDKMNDWQELVTYIPPLVLIAAFIIHTRPFLKGNYYDYFCRNIATNFTYTAILHPYIKEIDEMLLGTNGLNDLHIHLNGSTETDIVWQDSLRHYEKVSGQFKNSLSKEILVKEQWEQEISWNKKLNLYDLLLMARSLRHLIYDWIFNKQDVPTYFSSIYDFRSNKKGINNSDHPFAQLIPNHNNDLAIEGLMYVIVIDAVRMEDNQVLSGAFHCYLLILGLMHRLVVHQKNQNGFTQFQKITSNNIRRNVEKTYYQRFLQLNGNEQNRIRFIEGRFAPQETSEKNLELISSIVNDWIKCNNVKAELRLVSHFIKRQDKDVDKNIRHYSERISLNTKANAIIRFIEKCPKYSEYLVGVDAAANELDAQPEVFAPIFRYLRQNGIKHITYHAGEDFNHLLGGMRAIFESVLFLNMQQYDRIGHGCAAGLPPKNWIKTIGKQLCVRKGEYMDDLIFANWLICNFGGCSLYQKTDYLRFAIEKFASEIFGKYYSTHELSDAWLIRWKDPLKGFYNNELFELYHNDFIKNKYNEVIVVNSEEFFSEEEYEQLQLILLKFLHDKNIIIEALPTSNIRIGYYSDFESYHLWKWLQWSNEGKPVPQVVLGTDDTGIFVTNIYNEFANLYCNLVYRQNYSQSKAIELLKSLNSNGQMYKFW